MLQAELRVTSGKQSGSTIALPAGKFLVGREEDCHLRPNSDLVSRHHCVFTLDEYGLRLRDLGSTNGSFVNGEQIRGAVVLKSGDRVSIGKLDFQVLVGDPITDETRTNLSNNLDTQLISSPKSEPDDTETQAATDDGTDFATLAEETQPESTSSTETLIDLPTQQPSDVEMPVYPPMGDTNFYPPQGQGMPPQMPVGYPGHMGYPQGMMMPYGYPGYPQQMGYPQAPMGYPPGMYPPQQQIPAAPPEPEAPAKPAAQDLDIRLPDPSQTGAKSPTPPPAPAPDAGGGDKKDERTVDQKAKEEAPTAAADAIQQYLQRRPKGGK